MTKENEKDFQTANSCHICDKFHIEGDNQVKHYCHVKGKQRGSAHRKCNVNFRLTNRILVVYQRMSLSFIMQDIVNFEKKNMNVTPNNIENLHGFHYREKIDLYDL